jgi:hypothetical protein
MLIDERNFRRSVLEQIAINAARTPEQRMQALCDLLDAAREMAPSGPEAQERRRRALRARQENRERLREHFRRLLAAQRDGTSPRL